MAQVHENILTKVYQYKARPDLLPAYWEFDSRYWGNEFVIAMAKSASKLAQTDRECMFAVWFASHDHNVWGQYTGFDISTLPWNVTHIEEDRTFLLAVISAALDGLGNANRVNDALKIALPRLSVLIQSFAAEHANTNQEIIWAYNDDHPPREFKKCPCDQVYLHENGCVVCRGGGDKTRDVNQIPGFYQQKKDLIMWIASRVDS